MTISVTALTLLVGTAVLITALAPFVMMILWIRDWLRGQLW
jgi:hypothetical protein